MKEKKHTHPICHFKKDKDTTEGPCQITTADLMPLMLNLLHLLWISFFYMCDDVFYLLIQVPKKSQRATFRPAPPPTPPPLH